jgi:hypothetical protein
VRTPPDEGGPARRKPGCNCCLYLSGSCSVRIASHCQWVENGSTRPNVVTTKPALIRAARFVKQEANVAQQLQPPITGYL